jgi:aminoglycoside phosphotransferase (APT) family kinase protein
MSPPNEATPIGTPASDFHIDDSLVRALLEQQHPDLAHLPIQTLDAGWDNSMFRLGEVYCVRLPRRESAAALIENEQTWLPRLARQLSLPIPSACRFGESALGYPWKWSVLPWLPGTPADLAEPDATQAVALAKFLRSLHTPAPSDAPPNAVRGVPLWRRAAAIEERMRRLSVKTDLMTKAVKRTWETALQATCAVSSKWLHGDLHARNVLVENGVITGIIDWGDITSGDVATDLAAIWSLFSEPHARQKALSEYADISEATLQRAKGWAILFGVVLLDTGLIDHPRHARMGEQILRRLTADS